MQLRRGLAVLALGICCAWPAFSQDDGQRSRSVIAVAQKEKAAPAKKVSPRLPNNYGKLELSAEQRDSIYNIQAVANGQIDDLEEKIRVIKEKRDADIEGVLTPAQKQKLLTLQNDAKKKKEGKAKNSKPAAAAEKAGDDQ